MISLNFRSCSNAEARDDAQVDLINKNGFVVEKFLNSTAGSKQLVVDGKQWHAPEFQSVNNLIYQKISARFRILIAYKI